MTSLMNSHTHRMLPPTDNKLSILQLNTRRSWVVTHSLLNDPASSRFHFLLIQEPYISPMSKLPITHSNWTSILPDLPADAANAPPEDSTIKTLIYANKAIPTTAISLVKTHSNCVTATKLLLGEHSITLISSYAPPKQAHKLEDLRPLLSPPHTLSRTAHVLVAMDCNLHHTLWNPPSYSHTHREAEDLILTMSAAGLDLRSECGVPTFYPPNPNHANTTVDLTWISSHLFDWATLCQTDIDFTHSHLSDHAGIITELSLPGPMPRADRTYRRWKTFDPAGYEEALKHNLTLQAPALSEPPSSQQDLDVQADVLTSAVTAALDTTLPKLALRPNAKRWWDAKTLNPLKTKAQQLRRAAQRQRTHQAIQAYTLASNAYREAIVLAKNSHWHDFLASLSPSTLFTASKYVTSTTSVTSLPVPPLRRPDGSLTSDPPEQATLLFLGTSAPTIACDLEDVSPTPPTTTLPAPFTLSEIEETITALLPDKAPGPDEITNRVIKAGGRTLSTQILRIANQCLNLGLYPTRWKRARTIILRKPNKPDYANPSSYRPIALLSCLSKVVEALIAFRMKAQAESTGIIPCGHYGGRPQRSTEDALTHLTTWTKNHWSKGRFVGALFVDVKAAFPTVNPVRLADTLRRQGFEPGIVRLITAYLSNRSTTIMFGDFESSHKTLTIGLPQGSPLSVILYILYNSSLLKQAYDMPHTSALGFVDDVAFLTADRSLNTVRRRLQILANRELAWGSRHGAAFDQKKSQWLLLTRRPLPDDLPHLRLGAEKLQPQESVKWLGVTLDRKLNFASHGRSLEKKGTRVVLQLARLARTGWGIPLAQCAQLTSSLIQSRTDYAACVWHRHSENTAAVKAIQRIDNTAQRFQLGVFRTHPLVFLKHDTASPSAILRLNSKTEKSFARMLSLPSTNPAATLVREAAAKPRRTHKAGIQCALLAPSSVLRNFSCTVERLNFTDTLSPPHSRMTSLIADSKEAAQAFVTSQLGHLTKHDPTRVLLFSDRSLIPQEGVGAAALHVPSSTLYPACLGDTAKHTVYEAELVGIRLAVEAAYTHLSPFQRSFWLFVDNQASIRALSRRFTTSPGLPLRSAARKAIDNLLRASPSFSLTMVWCPAHVGIPENEEVDGAAKEATNTGTDLNLPTSLAALRQSINANRKALALQSPNENVIRRLRGQYNPSLIRKALTGLARPAAAAIAQLRAGHTPLSSFLYRIQATDSPNCTVCDQPETTEHYLMLCSAYTSERNDLFKELRKLKIPRKTQDVLTNPSAFEALATYISRTGRFVRTNPTQPPSSNPPLPSLRVTATPTTPGPPRPTQPSLHRPQTVTHNR